MGNRSEEIINTAIEEHTHRAVIGFDKNGVSKVLKPVSGKGHTHVDGNEYHHDHDGEFVEDYMKAISAYRKTFPKKDDVIENTPNPAVK